MGNHTITAFYTHTGSFNDSNTLTPLAQVVNKAGTTLTAAAASGTYGGTVNLSATLTKTSDSSPVSGKSISFTLNGTSYGPATTDSNGVATVSNVSLCGPPKINAGSYPAGAGSGVAASFAGDSSYNSSNGSNSLDVTKTSLTITAAHNGKTYDCTKSAAATPTYSGLQSCDSLTGLAEEYADANAGTGKTLNVTAYTLSDGNGGNNDTVSTVSDTTGVINMAPTVTTVTVSNTTYDCFLQGGTANVTSGTGTCVLNQSLPVKYIGRNATVYGPSNTAPTNAGDYTAQARYMGDANHLQSNDSKDFTIAQADATISVTGYSVTYECNEHKATGTATGVCTDNLSADLDFSGTAHTNAVAAHTDTVTFHDPNGNYKDATRNVTDEIKKADPTIHITPYNVTYDHNPHTATGTATGACGENLLNAPHNDTLSLSGTTHTNPGDYNEAGRSRMLLVTTITPAVRLIRWVWRTTSSTTARAAGRHPGGVILPPINSDGTSIYPRKGGSTIPVKFTVCDAAGNPIADPAAVFAGTGGSLTMLSAVRAQMTTVNESAENAIPDVAFRFTGSQWIFNMGTNNLQSGTDYTFRINLAYGSIIFKVGIKVRDRFRLAKGVGR